MEVVFFFCDCFMVSVINQSQGVGWDGVACKSPVSAVRTEVNAFHLTKKIF